MRPLAAVIFLFFCLLALAGCKQDCSAEKLRTNVLPKKIDIETAQALREGVISMEGSLGIATIAMNQNQHNIKAKLNTSSSLRDIEKIVERSNKELQFTQKAADMLLEYEPLKEQLDAYIQHPEQKTWQSVWVKLVIVYQGLKIISSDPLWLSDVPKPERDDFSQHLNEYASALKNLQGGCGGVAFSKQPRHTFGVYSVSPFFESLLSELKNTTPEKVEAQLLDQLKQDPGNVEKAAILAAFYYLIKEDEKAGIKVGFLLEHDPQNPRWHFLHALLQGRPSSGLESLDKAVALGGGFFELFYQRYKILNKEGKMNAARAALEQAILLAPKNPSLLLERGRLNQKADPVQALADFQSVVKFAGNDQRFASDKRFALTYSHIIELESGVVEKVISLTEMISGFTFEPQTCSIKEKDLPPIVHKYLSFCQKSNALYKNKMEGMNGLSSIGYDLNWESPAWNLLARSFYRDLPKWTALWKEFAAYYYFYSPNSGFEAYLITAPFVKAALQEAEIVAMFMYLTFDIEEYDKLQKELQALNQRFGQLEKATFSAQYRALLVNKNPLQRKVPDIPGNARLGPVGLSKLFRATDNKFKEAGEKYKGPFTKDMVEGWEKDLGPIVRSYILNRLVLGDNLDDKRDKTNSGGDYVRIYTALETITYSSLYLKYRVTGDAGQDWAKFAVDAGKLMILCNNAIIKYLNLSKEVQSKQAEK